jgi:hypothetical protein
MSLYIKNIIGVGAHSNGVSIDETFKFTVDTTKAGSASDTFVLPFYSLGTYNLTVYWGDGNSDVITTYNDANLTHVYSSSGSYQITLDGAFSAIFFNNGGDKLKMSSIDQWGTNVWEYMTATFRGCTNLTAAYSDFPDTSSVTTMQQMFRGCTSFNGAVDFDTSSVTDFYYMFQGCTAFNQVIDFDTSSANATNTFSSMFSGCTIFNSTITLSDTSLAKKFNNMFSGCTAFNQAINFNTSASTTFAGMFLSCSAFNQSITFTANSCTTTQSMFQNCTVLNSAISITTSSSLTTCFVMFKGAPAFNSSLTISDTSGVTSMANMFQNCTAFDQDISGFSIVALTNATSMLQSSGFGTTNYDLLLVAWEGQTEQTGVTFHAGSAKYSAGAPATAHGVLTGTSTWTITDGGPV